MSMERYQHGGNIWNQDEPLKWLDFSANINPWGPPAEMIRAIKDALPAVNRYPDPLARSATAAVATYLQVPAENLLLVSGGLAGLELLVNHLRPAAAVICQPAFVEYERLSRLHAIPVHHLVCLRQRCEWHLSEEQLSQIVSDALVFLCNPSNPCGALLKREQVKQVLQLVAAHSGRLLLDEAFIDFVPAASARQLALSNERLLVAGSLTKLFAIPGLRLGYLIGTSDLIAELRKRQTPWSLNLLAQAAAEVLPSLTGFVTDSQQRIAQARTELTAGLTRLGITVLASQVNFLLADFLPLGLTARAVNQQLMDSHIQMRDCSNFVGLDEHFARVAVLTPASNQRLLACLEPIACGI